MHIIISRDISERKKAERELLEMTLALERRVTERTAELSASEARFRAIIVSFSLMVSPESRIVKRSPPRFFQRHILSMAMDITQRKRAEEELVKTRGSGGEW